MRLSWKTYVFRLTARAFPLRIRKNVYTKLSVSGFSGNRMAGKGKRLTCRADQGARV